MRSVEVHPQPDVVSAFDPAEIRDILVLRITSVIRHVALSGAERREAVVWKVEARPAAFETTSAVRSRDAQYIPADVPVSIRLLAGGVHTRPPDMRVYYHVPRPRIVTRDR